MSQRPLLGLLHLIPVTPYDVADFGQQAFELEGQIRFTEMQLLGRTVDD